MDNPFDFRMYGENLTLEQLEAKLLQARVNSYNQTVPKEPDGLDIPCPICNQRGDIAVVSRYGQFSISDCPECGALRRTAGRLKRQGLWERSKALRLDNFQADTPTRAAMKRAAESFLMAQEDHWMAMLGQSGAGKTHLCTAVFCEMCRRTGLDGQYLRWVQDGRNLKLSDRDDGDTMRKKFMEAPILYIDDFMKNMDGERPSAADVRLAFEILDHRYNRKLPTIISSEWTVDQLCSIDQAVGGRICEMCGPYMVNVARDAGKNYRLHG